MSKFLKDAFRDAHVKDGFNAIRNAQDIEFETDIAREGLSTTKAEKREMQKWHRRTSKVTRQAGRNRRKWEKLRRRYG